MDIKYKTIKIGKISGTHYFCGKKTDTILVWAIGGPTVPDNGDLAAAPIILKRGIDLFVPDYLGFGRSDGIFTPKNCIKTLLLVYKSLVMGVKGISYYDDSKITLKYKRIIFVGKSLGGAYVPLLPRFNGKITEIGIFCGAVDQSEQGGVYGEETNEDFVRTIEKGGYKYLYRGFVENKKVWLKHLNDLDGLSPMDNIKYLKNAKVFIGHGKKDECIHYSKAENYYNKIIGKYPNQMSQFKLKLYPSGDHGKSTALKATRDFLDWIRI
jgi:esterase/lipase